jgi:NAD+ kinase
MKVFIYGQYWKEQDVEHVDFLLDKLEMKKVDIGIYTPYVQQVSRDLTSHKSISDYNQLKSFAPDVIITLGGDGTILSAITLIKDLEIPIMGINLGRLGFLASIEQERIATAINKLISGDYGISKRSMIRMNSTPDIFGDDGFALNDFTLVKRDNSAMVVIHVFIDNNFLNSYWADGLIISTPTGSTGYSLSCGGPIIFPSTENFILTPVAPHNLNVRPIVISGDNKISIQIEGRSENYLCTLDSRNATVTSYINIQIEKNNFHTNIITLEGDNFMKTIRNKLNWGMDRRNYEN